MAIRLVQAFTRNREASAVGVSAVAIMLYTLLVLASGLVDMGEFFAMWSSYIEIAYSLWVFVGLGAAGILLIPNSKATGERRRMAAVLIDALVERWQRDRGLTTLWPPMLFATLMASFNAFKQIVLMPAGFHYDALLAQMDRALFFGHTPWNVLHSSFPAPGFALAIDRLYQAWFLPMAVGVMICAWGAAASYRLRNQYLFSYLGVWIIIGSGLAYLFPAAGPCFTNALVDSGSSFSGLTDALEAQQLALGDTNIAALTNQEFLLSLQGSGKLAMGGGISAMPSVHNALAVLFALAAWQINRTLGGLMWAYAFLIWFGSVYLGWHYAIDGLVSAAATLIIWRGSGKLADVLADSPAAAQPVFPHPVIA
jgi:PAP2 superfamily